MRQVKISICVFIALLVLSGCDLYVDRQPYNYENSIWMCDEPKITYFVDEASDSYAVANIDGQEVTLSFCFRSSMIDIYKRDENGLDSSEEYAVGECKYSSKKFTVNIDKKNDTLFAGQYETLIFNRVNQEGNK